ncbi:hypothetical protein FOA52_015289 [Chlamydomonas sp. UWO 241]|nr:hypothetical protein FOA52_015289 [Chlamydomonas sp. UWO 241]
MVAVPGQGRGLRTSTVANGLSAGIVGLPNVGKSTLFNAVVENGKAAAANFPFCTIEPNTGIVVVPDPRLAVLSAISGSKELLPATVEFVDIAGLVKGASTGEGMGNMFLTNIRDTDAICQVVRCFEDDDIIHVSGKVDPLEDIEVINLELALSDLGQIEKRLERLRKGKKSKAEADAAEIEESALTKMTTALESGSSCRAVALTPDELASVKSLGLLTLKPMIYCANVPEGDLANQGANNVHVQALRKKAAEENCEVVIASAKVEAELNEMPLAERAEWLEMLGVTDGGLGNLIKATFKALGLQTYFTTGEKETRAWTIRTGMTAPQAAGIIHTDFEKGFIRAETIAYDAYVKHNGVTGAKEAGVLRLEGKEYVVAEGDVMLFRFNV